MGPHADVGWPTWPKRTGRSLSLLNVPSAPGPSKFLSRSRPRPISLRITIPQVTAAFYGPPAQNGWKQKRGTPLSKRTFHLMSQIRPWGPDEPGSPAPLPKIVENTTPDIMYFRLVDPAPSRTFRPQPFHRFFAAFYTTPRL